MATLPAWRTIDPLPVLKEFNDDDEDDEETLETLVDTNKRAANDSDKKKGVRQRHIR